MLISINRLSPSLGFVSRRERDGISFYVLALSITCISEGKKAEIRYQLSGHI